MRIDASGRVTKPYQPHINGSPRNTTGAGDANSFFTSYSRNTLSFTNGRVTVPIAGVYLITFNTISDTSTGRVDSRILVNGTTATQALSEDNGQGFHFKSLSIALSLSANDYIEFYNADWYNHGSSGYEAWRTASVTLLS